MVDSNGAAPVGVAPLGSHLPFSNLIPGAPFR